MRAIRVKDLREQLGQPEPRPRLKCFVCGEEYSADAGDYFMANPETVFKHHRRNMVLVTKHTVYEAAG